MLEHAFRGGKRYWALIGLWALLAAVGTAAYSVQLTKGLTVTGMSRDVSWGLYISQFTFMVGVAASAVMVVLPYYLHDYKAFGRMVILGECLAVSSVLTCQLFIFVDLGKPMRVLNVMLHPTPNSPMFWDMIALTGYLLLNLVIGWTTFDAERKNGPPPKWVKPLIYLSIPWAISIHTVTAFLYSGLSARAFWMTAVLAPRFLASAFASGPSLLIVLALLLRKYTKFDPGDRAVRKLAEIVAYAVAVNLFLVLVEMFTGIYSNMPHHLHPLEYLYLGLEGKGVLVPWMWLSAVLTVVSLVLLLIPAVRKSNGLLTAVCLAVIVSVWIDKGMGLVVTGFIPSPLGKVTEYTPTAIELMVALGVYGIGLLVLTALYRIVVNVREQQLPASASRE